MPTFGVGIAEHTGDGQTKPGGQVHGTAVAAEQAVAASEAVHQLTQTASRKGLYTVAERPAQVRRFPIVPGDEEEWIPIPAVPKTVSYP